ncbi:hypothetical protein NQ318_005577 [Aromia moschata]|uniref:Uncharacterized protein n=1 Tax=Aromia moschata TaxID=1265417 RepID=A0AAV8XJJ2_9CUCU|nr:hypothetical protein NQ318_005577 [Aromia moschata]
MDYRQSQNARQNQRMGDHHSKFGERKQQGKTRQIRVVLELRRNQVGKGNIYKPSWKRRGSADKKRLTDRINSFTVIEHDLNMEIDRLVRLTGEQRKKLPSWNASPKTPVDQPDYQYQVDDFVQTEDRPKSPLKSKKGDKTAKSKSAPAKKGTQKGTRKQSTSSKAGVDVRFRRNGDNSPPLVGNSGRSGSQAVRRCCCEAGSCVKHLRAARSRNGLQAAMQQIDSLKQEKEYYMKEYHKVCEELRNVPTQDRSDRLQQQNAELLRRMEEKDRMIANLQEEIRKLGREQFNCVPKKGRELEVLKNTLKDVEGENESLKKEDTGPDSVHSGGRGEDKEGLPGDGGAH